MEFGTVLRILFVGAVVLALPPFIYAGFRAAMATVRDMEAGALARRNRAEAGGDRLAALEQRVAQLEEQVDFAERALAQLREPVPLAAPRER